MYVVIVLIVTPSDLAASKVGPQAIGIFVIDRKVVENVSTVIGNLASAGRHCFDRWFILHAPGDLIDTMNGLLHQAISTEPREVIPIAHLPIQIGHTAGSGIICWHGFHRPGVVCCVDGPHITNVSLVYFVIKGTARIVVAPAEACYQGKFLGFSVGS